MSEFKGTPGPWSRDGYEFFNSDGANIFDLTYGSRTGTKEDEANTNLIAAAPEMLSLLEWLIDIEGPQPGHAEWAIKVQHVISKALGESK